MENRREKKGAFAPSQADRKANGVASAKPTVITGSEDATVNRDPPGRKRQKDWDVGFDDEQPDRS
ncbi:hypothetical protein [Sinorhizobium sp. RAC02]|uniref:hypothetical protein n=1 Tax=Sinorhizobium sp. RAC02 TaxID=1842534 RepID=UPI00083E1026|nr:hypothetical protein [Sinorhizobium sp. RAC02]AOF93713.1 hypothetical protein BSY16_4197 [Sinorhizobium sp. RAC02]